MDKNEIAKDLINENKTSRDLIEGENQISLKFSQKTKARKDLSATP